MGRLMLEPGAGEPYERSLYLTAETCRAALSDEHGPAPSEGSAGLRDILKASRPGDAGLCVFCGPDAALAVVPPFPVERDERHAGFEPGPALALMARDRTALVVLVRLGRYSVGVLRGERVVASKSGTRYVKRPHRAGGSSQRRFERSRERLEREFYDAVCRATRGLIERSEVPDRLDFVLFGGAPGTVRGFRGRCELLSRSGLRSMSRLLDVERPGHRAMQGIGAEVYSSALLTFRRAPQGAG